MLWSEQMKKMSYVGLGNDLELVLCFWLRTFLIGLVVRDLVGLFWSSVPSFGIAICA